jgi:hypothetical protein
MAITRQPPETIWLGGARTEINDRAASESVTPGHLVELFNSSGTIRYRKHGTAGALTPAQIATEASMLNKGVDDVYAANDLIEVSHAAKGSTWWMLIASGQNIVAGNELESAGDGTLRILNSGEALFTAIENKPTVLVTTRIRVEAL